MVTGQDYQGIHNILSNFFENQMKCPSILEEKDKEYGMALKHNITHLYKCKDKSGVTFPQSVEHHNMATIYTTVSDFLTDEQGWELK